VSDTIPESMDAFGASIHARWRGDADARLVIERDDRLVDLDSLDYLAPFGRWPAHERQAMRRVQGRVLDVGCGAGRVAVHLEPRGHEVVSIDVSPGAIRTARERGARDVRPLAASGVRRVDGPFDTIVMFGNNAGLLRDARHAPWLLRRFARNSSDDGLVLASTLDPYDGAPPVHRSYHRRNRARGRMGGQIRIRARYQRLSTPWFDYLFTSVPELDRLIRNTGWRLDDVIHGAGPTYAFVLKKD
jgi:SAM-dependent methyltransferase